MRKIQNIAFVLLATLFAGCINDHIENTLCRDGVLSLNLSTGATTRTDTPNNGYGEGENDDEPSAESAIKDIQFFLYPDGSTESEYAIFAGRIDVTASDTTEQTVTVSADDINTLCPNPGDECDIYVIVNYFNQQGEDLTTADDTSRATLKDKALNKEFYTDAGAFVLGPQSFVMDSEVFSVTRGTGDDSNKLTSETIYVTRAAAKILIEVTVQSTVDVSGVKWEALTDVDTSNPYYMSLDFFNGVKDGVIDDDSDINPDGKDIRPASTAEGYSPYYYIENVMMNPGGVGSEITNPDTSAVTRAETEKKFVPMTPLYSYTSSWNDNDEDAPYFKLSIPWRKIVEGQDDNAAWVTYDYTVPISLKTNRLVRNKLYLIRLNVGALGDLDYLDPAVYSYVVLDWEDVSMNAELSRPSYLVVDTNYIEMNNVETISVGYQSSDKIAYEVLSTTISEWQYITVGSGYSAYQCKSAGCVYPTYSIDTSNGNITFTHQLDNTTADKDYDYFAQTTVVKVYHENNPDIYEIITFVQYPAFYVINDPGYHTSSDQNNNYVFVNGSTSSGGNAAGNGEWWYTKGSPSKEPNVYTINISAFDENSANYLICDPREPANNDNFVFYNTDNGVTLNTVKATAKDESGDNTLTGYRATLMGDVSENLIAPSFIIASSCGSYSGGDKNLYVPTEGNDTNAKFRCAGYQEAGYPAGRWRLPTPAELKVVGRLCAEKKIPTIFYDGAEYLSSNGAYRFDIDAGTFTYQDDNSDTMRCVYDAWYWKDKCADPSQFIWAADGDNILDKMARNFLVSVE